MIAASLEDELLARFAGAVVLDLPRGVSPDYTQAPVGVAALNALVNTAPVVLVPRYVKRLSSILESVICIASTGIPAAVFA